VFNGFVDLSTSSSKKAEEKFWGPLLTPLIRIY
jgi:hypothetical protein